MKIIQLSFSENPALYTAQIVEREKINPAKTLIISPTQRFKSYFASYLLQIYKSDYLLSPTLLTSSQLLRTLASLKGFQIANDSQIYSMLYEACQKTDDVERLFGHDFLNSYMTFRNTAKSILNAFDELNSEEIEIGEIGSRKIMFPAYRAFERHAGIFQDLYHQYESIQKENELFSQSFLFRFIGDDDITRYFAQHEVIILVSPLSLTGFEKRVYKAIYGKLWVIYQDSSDYDFSGVINFKKLSSCPEAKKPNTIGICDIPSRSDQLMTVLSIIGDEMKAGRNPQDIAVINIDSVFCEMLYDSLFSSGCQVNYSEGIKVKKSSLYGFFKLIEAFFKSGLDSLFFLEILKNNLFQEACLRGRKIHERKIRESLFTNRIFTLGSLRSPLINKDRFLVDGFSFIEKIYKAENFEKLSTLLNDFLSRFRGRKPYDFYAVKEIFTSTAIELSDFKTDLNNSPFEIFLLALRTKKYPLQGVYSQGIQIVGLLETRGITFKTVIVPSFNEGFFPVKSDGDVLLNLNVRKNFGLPTIIEQENLQFYYLKRVIDSAESPYILSLNDRTGEIDVRSRFWYFFTEEKYLVSEIDTPSMLPVKSFPMDKAKASEISMPSLLYPIQEFSRMDVDRIKKCEVKYYISRILKIEEEEFLNPEVEMSLVGSMVHNIFKELYREFGGEKQSHEYHSSLDVLFDRYFRDGFFYTGEELLVKNILKSNLHQALEHDLFRFSRGYRICREFMERDFCVSVGNTQSQYSLSGRIDRIDQSPGGGYMIIDYKTGKLPDKRNHFKSMDYKEIQLGFYGLLFQKSYPEVRLETLSYFDLSGKRDLEIMIGQNEMELYLEDFEEHLVHFLDEFNQKERLGLTDDHLNCRYCPYYNICRVFEE